MNKLTYTIAIEPGDEQHAFGVVVPDFSGWVWALVEVEDVPAKKTPVRLNVSLPEYLVHRIDEYATAHHLTRSGFLAKAAQEAMCNG